MKTKAHPTPKAQKGKSQPRANRTASVFRKILVPVDFSEAGKPALEHARSLAQVCGASVQLLHVREMVYTEATIPVTAFESAEMRKHIEREMGTIQTKVFKGVKTAYEVCDGLPFQEIVLVASRLGCDLVVMATHGYTGLKHILLGSTAERVVRYAPCPVLVIRSHPLPGGSNAKGRRVRT